MSATRWDDVLDAFEARLDAQAEALDAGGMSIVAPFDPPADIDPLPRELAQRAAQLTQRCRAIEQDIAQALAAAGVSLERHAAAPAAATAAAEPVYFDSRV